MKRSKTIQLSVVTSVAATLLSCRPDRPTRYCVDQNQQVTDDGDCTTARPGHYWYYGGRHGYVPIGTRLSGGSFQTPSEGFSTPSGTTRGGIGATGEAMSGGHGGGE